MILVVAVAVGLVLIRQPRPFQNGPSRIDSVWNILAVVTAFLAPSTIALLAIRLRPPRPRFRRLARNPGFVACQAASAAIILAVIPLGIARVLNHRISAGADSSLLIAFCTGFAVLGAWVTLASSGRWRLSAPGGVELLGWLVGLAWLSIMAILWVTLLVAP